MTRKIVALVLAKSQSNRLPNKNNLEFNGRPMFLENVIKCRKLFGTVYVSSDSGHMLHQAEAVGAIPILRSEELCGDTPNIPVYQHALTYMGKVDAIVAVQANSPTIEQNTIAFVKKLMVSGVDEVMTCHPDRSIYGSVWAIERSKLESYGDPYNPQPSVLVVDRSVDIHTKEDYERAKGNGL